MWYSSATFAAATASVGIALASVAVNVVYGTFETISLALLLLLLFCHSVHCISFWVFFGYCLACSQQFLFLFSFVLFFFLISNFICFIVLLTGFLVSSPSNCCKTYGTRRTNSCFRTSLPFEYSLFYDFCYLL